jgi:phage terminase small subunit
MGRPRNDAAIQRAKGTDKQAIGRNTDRVDATPPPGTPDMPPYVNGRAVDFWHETILKLQQVPDLLTIVDGATIADICLVMAQKEMIEAGMQAEVNKKRSAISKAQVIMRYQSVLEKLRMRQNVLASELGMSPRSRSQIKVRAPKFVPTASAIPGSQAPGVKPLVTDPVLCGGSSGLQRM